VICMGTGNVAARPRREFTDTQAATTNEAEFPERKTDGTMNGQATGDRTSPSGP
jgi:hypothetical protein